MRTLAVLTAVADRWEAGVVAGLTRVAGVEVVRRCVDLADLVAVASTGVAHVALVSADLRGLDLSAVRDLRDAGCAVVAVLDPAAPESDEARVRQLGVEHVVVATALGPDVAAVLREAAGSHPQVLDPDPQEALPAGHPVAPDDAPVGRVVTVWGAAGAPGRTTVAVTLAAELAAAGEEVLLVDADTYAAAVAQTLGLLDEVAGVATACRNAEQGALDVVALSRIAPVVEPRLRVLTGLPRPDRWTEVRQAALERVLDVARRLVDVVVVDVAAPLEDDEELSYDTVAPRRNMAALTAVDVADELVVVGAADPVGLARLVRALDELSTRDREPTQIVVTKVRKATMGPRPGEQTRDILAKHHASAPLTLVQWSPDVFDAALLRGRAVTTTAPTAPARTALRGLAAQLTPAGH